MTIADKRHHFVGADSRTTTGAYIANRVTDKLTRVHDTIWCCRSGSAADTQAVADIVQYQLGLFAMLNGKPPTTQTAAAIFQEICYSNKDQLRYANGVLDQGERGAVTVRLWDVDTNCSKCRLNYRGMGRAIWRPGVLDTLGWLSSQASIFHWWLWVDLHLRLLRLKLAGGDGEGRSSRVC